MRAAVVVSMLLLLIVGIVADAESDYLNTIMGGTTAKCSRVGVTCDGTGRVGSVSASTLLRCCVC
jgi:hypothetical protein